MTLHSLFPLLPASDRPLLRSDYLRQFNEDSPASTSSSRLPPAREALLHLTSEAPGRYAVVKNIFGEIEKRLGGDQTREEIQKTTSDEESSTSMTPWRPKRIVEHGGASGEGLWAAAEIFGGKNSDQDQNSGLESYEVIDSRIPLLRSGIEIIERSLSESKGGIKFKTKGIEKDGEAEKDSSEDSTHLLSGIDYTFRTPSGSALKNSSTPNSFLNTSKPKALKSTIDPRHTLSLSSYSLSNLPTDAARLEHVDSLWSSGSEVIVLIENSDQRGFSCIASARERLLELGRGEEIEGKTKGWKIGRHVFVEEGQETVNEEINSLGQEIPKVEGSHVVAPCPHDKPCPLLHSFLPLSLEPSFDDQLEPQVSTSPIQRPAGFSICSFSQILQRPSYLRKTKNVSNHKGGEEGRGYCYVVIRRGERPGVQAFENGKGTRGDGRFGFKDLAERSKTGQLEEIRSGKNSEQEVGEILKSRDAENTFGDEFSSRGVTEEEIGLQDQDQEGLDELLPQVLATEVRNQMQAENQVKELDEEQELQVKKRVEEILSGMRNRNEEEVQEEVEEIHRENSIGNLQDIDVDSEVVGNVEEMDSESREEAEFAMQDDVEDLEELAMRIESYQWPRLIKPPIKKGGHVIVDSCSSSGEYIQSSGFDDG